MNSHSPANGLEVRHFEPDAIRIFESTYDGRVTAEAPHAGAVVGIVDALEALAAYADFQRHSAA